MLKKLKKGRIVILLIAIILILVIGIFSFLDTEEQNGSFDWREHEFNDVRTGDTFSINEFDKPVLIESFAVWCPTCKKQQDNMKKLHDKVGDSVVSISINTDPNEDKDKVLEHVQRYGYDWFFTLSPPNVTQDMIDEFGVGVVNAPSAPVILVCGNESTLLGKGLKSTNELQQKIGEC